MQQMISSRAAAKYLGISEGTLANARCSGIGAVIKFSRIGGAIRYKLSDLEEYIDKNTFTHNGEFKELRNGQ